ncbi:hypothetical protein HN873_063272 [Arachis hypogaea]
MEREKRESSESEKKREPHFALSSSSPPPRLACAVTSTERLPSSRKKGKGALEGSLSRYGRRCLGCSPAVGPIARVVVQGAPLTIAAATRVYRHRCALLSPSEPSLRKGARTPSLNRTRWY